MFRMNQIRIAMSLVTLMLLSSTLPGCLETVSDVIEDDESTNPNAAPKEAMGMWWPTIDGHIEIPTLSPQTEWSDGDMKDIKFKDSSKGEHPATLRYKSVEEGMSLAVEIDDIEETPQKIVVTFPDRQLTTEITTESDAFLPMFEIDCTIVAFDCSAGESEKVIDGSQIFDKSLLGFMALNKIASVHDLDDDNLVMEASAKQLFDDTTEVSYTITIWFEQSIWTYTTIVDFDWVLPFLFPHSDISVTGIEVTQAIQTADMQMRLVEGKTSLARVYVDSGELETANVEVTLNFCILIFCFDEMTKTHVAVQNPDRTDFTHSANFVLPDHWVTFDGIDDPIPIGLIAKITPIYPTGAIDYVDPDTSNNHEVGVFWFNHTRDFVVWAVPIPQDTNGDGTLETRPITTINNWMADTEAMFPTANLIQINIDPASVTDGTGMTGDQINANLDAQTASTIAQINEILENGEVPPLPLPDQVHGITPAAGNTGGLADGAFWGGNSLVSWCGNSVGGNTVNDAAGSTCTAHEFTHNMGPIQWDQDGNGVNNGEWDERWGKHLEVCNADSGTNAWNVLYTIQDIGWDPLAANPDTNQNALYASQNAGYMGYCMASTGPSQTGITGGNWNVPYVSRLPQWIPTYAWEAYYDKFTNWVEGQPNAPSNGRSASSNNTFRMIQGVIPHIIIDGEPVDGMAGSLGHSWTSSGIVTADYRNNGDTLSEWDYSIVASDINGNEVEKIRFITNFENAHHEPRDHYFSYSIQDNNGLINSIELLDSNGSTVDMLYASGSPTTRVLPLGATEYTRENPANISWTQASQTSNRQTLYQLEYSWGAGMWLPIGGMTNSTSKVLDFGALPAGDDAKFRVRATNGFDTYYSESTSFSLPNQAPELTLETLGSVRISTNLGSPGQGLGERVTQGESFSITPEIKDADWTAINENGCKVVLKRGQETVWSHGNTAETETVRENNRITSFPSESLEHGPGLHDSIHCLHNNGAFLPYSFPNNDLLPGEMTPGNYEFEMTYEDAAGSSVTKTVSFSIIVPDYLVGPDSNAKTGDVLDEYRSNLQNTDLPQSQRDDLSRDEVRYYVELARAARGEDDALTDAEIDDLQAFYGISDSRATEISKFMESIVINDDEYASDVS